MAKAERSFVKEHWIAIGLLLFAIIVALAMVYLIATPPGQVSRREATLQAFVLTAASIFASFLITKIYAEATYSQSLRDHGVQIASGIMVLKRQIESLADWINTKRESLAQSSPKNSDLTDSVLEHVEQTLEGFRGMTDAALGGIAGVIGAALAEYENVMGQISDIRLEAREKTSQIEEEIETAGSSTEVAKLQVQIEEIAKETERRITLLARTSALPIIPELPSKRRFTTACPYCNRHNSYEMEDKVGETQVIVCDHCQKRFNAHVSPSHKVLARPRVDEQETQFQIEARWFLQKAHGWVQPKKLEGLLRLVVLHDHNLKQSGQPRFPFSLQSALLQDTEKLLRADISKTLLRRFIALIYEGGAFEPLPGSPMQFSSEYVNTLSDENLLKAYVRACIRRISAAVALASGHSGELAQLLLGPKFDGGEDLVKEGILMETRRSVRSEQSTEIS